MVFWHFYFFFTGGRISIWRPASKEILPDFPRPPHQNFRIFAPTIKRKNFFASFHVLAKTESGQSLKI
jgi:hypothetical protein